MAKTIGDHRSVFCIRQCKFVKCQTWWVCVVADLCILSMQEEWILCGRDDTRRDCRLYSWVVMCMLASHWTCQVQVIVSQMLNAPEKGNPPTKFFFHNRTSTSLISAFQIFWKPWDIQLSKPEKEKGYSRLYKIHVVSYSVPYYWTLPYYRSCFQNFEYCKCVFICDVSTFAKASNELAWQWFVIRNVFHDAQEPEQYYHAGC